MTTLVVAFVVGLLWGVKLNPLFVRGCMLTFQTQGILIVGCILAFLFWGVSQIDNPEDKE